MTSKASLWPPVMTGSPSASVQLAAQDPPVTLVLDDLHLLTDATVLDGLDYLLRNAGAGLRLVVSARRDPLPLHLMAQDRGEQAPVGMGQVRVLPEHRPDPATLQDERQPELLRFGQPQRGRQ